jgi:hypothetical protein
MTILAFIDTRISIYYDIRLLLMEGYGIKWREMGDWASGGLIVILLCLALPLP